MLFKIWYLVTPLISIYTLDLVGSYIGWRNLNFSPCLNLITRWSRDHRALIAHSSRTHHALITHSSRTHRTLVSHSSHTRHALTHVIMQLLHVMQSTHIARPSHSSHDHRALIAWPSTYTYSSHDHHQFCSSINRFIFKKFTFNPTEMSTEAYDLKGSSLT